MPLLVEERTWAKGSTGFRRSGDGHDLDARAERVRAVVEGNLGKAIDCDGNTIEIEIPADVATEITRTPTTASVQPN
jgi:hypothetical protein